jgi:hypothetical protein
VAKLLQIFTKSFYQEIHFLADFQIKSFTESIKTFMGEAEILAKVRQSDNKKVVARI